MLDLALAGFNHGWIHWLDVLDEARTFITSRPDPPGRRPRDDAFEIAWHKTSLALLEGQRRPDFVEKQGVVPLNDRMAAGPSADGAPRLTDPWIELTRGIAEEQWTITQPVSLALRGPVAIGHFDDASMHASTRPEALAGNRGSSCGSAVQQRRSRRSRRVRRRDRGRRRALLEPLVSGPCTRSARPAG